MISRCGLSPGVNDAVDDYILIGHVFVVDGYFDEVNPIPRIAITQIENTIVAFGGKIESRLSSKRVFLAGKSVVDEKLENAKKNQVRVINIRELKDILLGQGTIDS